MELINCFINLSSSNGNQVGGGGVVLFPYHILITTVSQSGNETEIYSSSILPVFQEGWRERCRTLPIQKLLPENLVAKERTRSEQLVYR